MKKYWILALLLLSLSGMAQAQVAGTLKRAGGSLKMDDVKLSATAQDSLLRDICGVDCRQAWSQARKGRSAGMGLVIGGGVTVAAGLTTVLLGAMTSMVGAAAGAVGGAVAGSIGGQNVAQQTASEAAGKGASAGAPFITGGLIATGVGVACLGAGIPLLAVNCRKMNNIVKDYNDRSAPEVQLSFAPAPDGPGLILRF